MASYKIIMIIIDVVTHLSLLQAIIHSLCQLGCPKRSYQVKGLSVQLQVQNKSHPMFYVFSFATEFVLLLVLNISVIRWLGQPCMHRGTTKHFINYLIIIAHCVLSSWRNTARDSPCIGWRLSMFLQPLRRKVMKTSSPSNC